VSEKICVLRIRVLLARDGIRIGRDRSARIWAAAGLQVPAKKPRKRYRTHRPQPFAATAPNEVWAYDFVFDGYGNGQKLKCLTLIDEFTKEGLAIDVAGTIRSTRVVKVLKEFIQKRGNQKNLSSDNGPEFVSTALLAWATESGLTNMLIEPDQPVKSCARARLDRGSTGPN